MCKLVDAGNGCAIRGCCILKLIDNMGIVWVVGLEEGLDAKPVHLGNRRIAELGTVWIQISGRNVCTGSEIIRCIVTGSNVCI